MLETNEAERTLVPDVPLRKEGRLIDAFPRLDKRVQSGRVTEATHEDDKIIGIPDEDVKVALELLRQRRLGRRRRRRRVSDC